MAFTPQTINGQHFLYSKNSGSFPNFGAFLTGSNGAGRLVAFYNISSTISCSASTPTGSFITGSNYIVDVTYAPSQLATFIYTNSSITAQAGANGTGSLSTSASLFLLNNSTSSNVGSVANLYNFKVYNPNLGLSFIRKNYNAQAARFGLPLATYIPPAPLLLDAYSGAAAAYSLRLLNTSYVGFAIRVRRSSDNTEADIGFNVNDELDTIALLAFCGAGNGFVKTWYDQSGNGYDATQATALNQPQIVSSGSVILDNNKPALQFDGSNDDLRHSNEIMNGSQLCMIGVAKKTVNTPNTRFLDQSGTLYGGGLLLSTPDRYAAAFTRFNGTLVDNNTTDDYINVRVLMFGNFTSGLSTLSINGSEKLSNSLTFSGNGDTGVPFSIGSDGAGNNQYHPGTVQEILVYRTSQLSNRTGIESNINNYYSIY
jgi:hypothetical protein